jgi:hypothetical protein
MATATYGTSEVARVAGLPESVLRSWVERRIVSLSDHDRDADGRSQTRLFTFETALQVAIGVELERLGFGSRRACAAAQAFAHSGSDKRLPGQLFLDGKTFLVVRPGKDNVAGVVREADLTGVFDANQPHDAALAIVEINQIFRRVARALRVPLTAAAML